MSNLWFGYFWPSLKGNGPEALVQTVVYAAIAVLLWPFIRKEIHKGEEDLHKKLDHLLKHKEILE